MPLIFSSEPSNPHQTTGTRLTQPATEIKTRRTLSSTSSYNQLERHSLSVNSNNNVKVCISPIDLMKTNSNHIPNTINNHSNDQKSSFLFHLNTNKIIKNNMLNNSKLNNQLSRLSLNLPSKSTTSVNTSRNSSSSSSSCTNSRSNSTSSKLGEKKSKSGSIFSLFPLKEKENTESRSSSRTNTSQSSMNVHHHSPKGNSKPSTPTNALPKKESSSSLTILDYYNITSVNTNYQMLANFSNLCDDVFEEKPLIKGSNSPINSNNQKNINIEKNTSLSDQMVALFGSSDCICFLCRNNVNPKSNQNNLEIVANMQNSDFSIMKYTYSTPLSQLSSTKLFNMFNCDCAIHFTPENVNSNFCSDSNSPNNLVVLSQQQQRNLTCSLPSSMHFDNNNPPIYDSRYMYLIDCRLSKKAFEKSRISTAIHYTDLLSESVYLSPPMDNFTIIVLYDEEGTFLISSSTANFTTGIKSVNNTNYFKMKSTNNKENRTDSVSLDIESMIDSDMIISSIRKKISCSSKKTFYILSGGFKQFSSLFPFMCTNQEIRSTVDRHKYLTIYPNCVIENQIYIGSGVQAKNWKIIRDLKVTHIINCSVEHDCVFQDELSYLWVKLEDTYQENIYKSLVKAYKFMQEAFTKYYEDLEKFEENNNGNHSRSSSISDQSGSVSNSVGGVGNILASNFDPDVMIFNAGSRKPKAPVFLIHCNLGISRSSSILIAYLIAKYKLCLYASFKYVKDKRLQIAPNYNFLKQLKQFEENYF